MGRVISCKKPKNFQTAFHILTVLVSAVGFCIYQMSFTVQNLKLYDVMCIGGLLHKINTS